VPANARFRAAGYDFDPSDPFLLLPGENRVIVSATLKPKSRTLPITMIVVGFTSMALIGPFLIAGGAERDQSGHSGSSLVTTGVIMTLGGAIAGVAGIVLLVERHREKRSRVTVTQRSGRLELPGGLGLEARSITF
jgi:hypothetical protein